MSFKTQQDIWLHLAQGGAVQGNNTQRVYKFENGELTTSFSFCEPKDWQPYVEPPRKVKKTFYRRKWALLDGEVFDNYAYRPSKGAFDDYHGVGYRDTVWSDEWETIEIEI